MSALLGRILLSAVGYHQPTLATSMGALQERITTTQKVGLDLMSVQAIYATADDLTGAGNRDLEAPPPCCRAASPRG